MIVVYRKVATLCSLEIGLELLLYAMPQARTVWQTNPAQRHIRRGSGAPGQSGLYCEGPRTSFDSSGSHELSQQLVRGAAPTCQPKRHKAMQIKL